MLRRFALACLVALAATAARAEEAQLTPLLGEVLAAPHAVLGSDGRQHLVYELRLANVTGGAARLSSLEVRDAASGAILATLDADAIAGRLSLGGLRGQESSALETGQFGVAFLHLALDAGSPLPAALTHRVTGHFEQIGRDYSMTIGPTEVVVLPPVVLGRPLAGAGYLAGDGCCDTIRHVRALLPLDGRFVLAQRFAIDWERADAAGRLVVGDTRLVENYRIFGQPVLAVADGTVVASRNDLPEQVPGALPAGLPIAEADGNFVVLDIGGGAFVLFAHMQPRSVTVVAGDRVRQGDVLGKVGNSGNSQAPHLHLHVMDGPAPLLSNGLPYVFEDFAITAFDAAGTEDFDRAEATGSPLTLTPVSPPLRLQRALPLDLTLVDFGE